MNKFTYTEVAGGDVSDDIAVVDILGGSGQVGVEVLDGVLGSSRAALEVKAGERSLHRSAPTVHTNDISAKIIKEVNSPKTESKGRGSRTTSG